MRTRSLLGACVASTLLVALPAHAAPPLYVPWPCDTTEEITQGHNTGSHTDKGAWAWDVGIAQGAEVVSPADGVVRVLRMDSTTGGCSSAYANDANYVVVDFGDGTEALFLHLLANSSPFSEGDTVKQGDVVGRVGLTGWVCGAHLHFQIQETCASWWCQSVPSSFVQFGDPGYGATIVSNNCPMLEPCAAVLDGGVTIVDEKTSCFERETSWWWSVPEGYEGHHWYTKATDAADDDTIGRWRFDVATAGAYRLEVFVPETEANSVAATYRVVTDGQTSSLGPIDQSTQKGWVELGVLELGVGEGLHVELGDATGEASSLERRLAYDAIRWTFVPDSGVGGAGGAGLGGGAAEGGGASSSGGAGGEGAGGGDATADGAADDGCSCAVASTGSAPRGRAWLVTALALALGLRRRRRT